MADEATVTLSANVQAELEQIAAADPQKLLRPEAVVGFARANPESALHGQFEWDDSKAAESYRFQQARAIIRAQVVILPQTRQQTRAWVSCATDRTSGGGYRKTEGAVGMPALRLQLAEEAFKSIETLGQRFSYLPELRPLFDELVTVARRHREQLASAPAAA